MGFLDDAKAKLTEAVDDPGDAIASGIDKAADAVAQRAGGHDAVVGKGADMVKDALDKLDGSDDDIQ